MRIVTFPELLTRFGLTWTRVHVNRMIAAGLFPQKVHLSPGRVGWIESEIQAWIQERADARPAPAATAARNRGAADARPAA